MLENVIRRVNMFRYTFEECIQAIRENDSDFKICRIDIKPELSIVDIKILSVALRHNTYIENLTLNGVITTEKLNYLVDALKRMHRLRSLSILTDSDSESIVDLMTDNTFITELNLSFCKLGDAGSRNICETLSHNHTLKSLNLRGNKIGNQGSLYLKELLTNNDVLEELNLVFNEFGAIAISHISEGLKRNNSLTHLNLSSTFGKSDNNSDACLKLLTRSLLDTKTVTHLYLADNHINWAARDSVERLLNEMNLIELDLGYNHFNGHVDLFMKPISRDLQTNDTLKILNLEYCSLDDEAAKCLAKMLNKNSTLRELHLSNNAITSSGVKDLQEALDENMTLEILSLKNNDDIDIDNLVAEQLNETLELDDLCHIRMPPK